MPKAQSAADEVEMAVEEESSIISYDANAFQVAVPEAKKRRKESDKAQMCKCGLCGCSSQDLTWIMFSTL